jgi:hypothetical protein
MTIGRVDAVGDQSTTPGTSDFVIDGVALTGMLAFAGKLTDGYVYRYRAQNSANTQWEVGTGTWTAATNTLSRTTVYQSSNGGAKTNFTDDAAVVITMTAADFSDAATDANISMSDITTNDVSITKHGFAPKAPNVTTQFLSGDGTWRTPAGGSPGGSDTQVQFNDSSSFGGDSGLTFNKTTNALTVGGATVTTSNPVVTATQTWNDSGVTFTGWKLNITSTASAAASLLMDLQLGGTSVFSVSKSGTVSGSLFRTDVAGITRSALGSTSVLSGQKVITGRNTVSDVPFVASTSDGSIGFTSSTTSLTVDSNPTLDTAMSRKAAKIIEFTSGSPGTYTGTAFGNGPQTVAQLPTASTCEGFRAFVSDASTTLALGIGTTVTGGGANKVPVYSDGTNWLYG